MSTPCLSRPCQVCSRPCLSRPCLSRPCHVCQDYFKFVRTMSCLSRICNFFQDHVIFVLTVFLKSTCFVNNFPSFRTKISQTWKSKTTTTTKICIGLRCMCSQSKTLYQGLDPAPESPNSPTLNYSLWLTIFQVDLIHIDAVAGNNTVEYGMDLSEYYLNVEWDILSVPAERHIKVD